MSTHTPKDSPDGESKKQQETFEDKVRENLKNVRDSVTNEEGILGYATNNKEQIATYALLVVGLIILVFNNLIGGLIIGMVAGYYFSGEIVYFLQHLKNFFDGQDHLRYLSLTALLLGLFIAAPGIFIGAAIVAAFKQLFLGKSNG